MERISRQQVRVFAMFSGAFVLTAYAYAFAAQGLTFMAVTCSVAVTGFVVAIFSDARHC